MKYALLFSICLALISCKYFDAKKTSSEDILNEELKTFNWDEVDTYPSFVACDSLSTKHEKKACFQRILTNYITSNLQKEPIIVTQDIHDTLNLEFKLSEKGILSLADFQVDSTTITEIPNLKSLIFKSLDSLPEIFPAVKRSRYVKTSFTLPLIIDVQ